MKQESPLVVFLVEGQRYALPLTVVERVTRVAALTPLPQAPGIVAGVVNLGGRVLPVIEVRRRLDLSARVPSLSDQFVIARLRARTVVLLVETVVGLETVPTEQIVTETAILPRVPYLAGVAKQLDGLILIHDLDQFLSLAEEQALEAALARL